jgi:hypothetical protein
VDKGANYDVHSNRAHSSAASKMQGPASPCSSYILLLLLCTEKGCEHGDCIGMIIYTESTAAHTRILPQRLTL